jgi:MHS family proline/betaine transporter-like MFS transporter
VLSSAFGVGLTTWMTTAEMSSWGWRIPFLFGVLVGPVGIYIRNHLEDATPPPSAKHESVVGKVFREQKLCVVLAIGALAVSTAVNYLVIYMPTYVVKTLNLAPSVGFEATLAAAIAVTILTPIAGSISDRIGRTRHMIAVGLVLLVSVFPAFLLLTRMPVPTVIMLAVLYLASLKAIYFGPLAALMSELFPAATRATGLGLSYNIGVTVFGGMGPAIMTWMGSFALFGDLAPGYYLTVIAVLSLCALTTIRKTAADSFTA